jgi:hypothetical protein
LVRADLRERGLIGRGTFIMLFNSAGELVRAPAHPEQGDVSRYWDVAAGGMVGRGKLCRIGGPRAGRRAGVSGVELRPRSFLLRGHRQSAVVLGVFGGVGRAVALQPEEVLEARFIPVEQACWKSSKALLPGLAGRVEALPG